MKHTGPGPLTGRALERRYVLGEQIARGGMGTVYRAHDERLDRPVAVKVLKDSVSEDRNKVLLFQKEARAAAAIADPHVVAVWDQGVDEEDAEPVAFLVMELVDGATLRDLIRRRSPMTVREALSALVPMVHGLAAAHRCGLVHRDVKPENVLVSPTGSVKVTDFGLTRQVGEESETITLMGSANYIAPEIVRRKPSGPAADVYAAGVVLYELLTGVPPFRGATPYAVSMAHVDEPMPDPASRVPGLAPGISRIVARCCAKDPRDRPADAVELLEDLNALESELADADLDRRPPGYRGDGTDLFSALAPDVHTRPVDLAGASRVGFGVSGAGSSSAAGPVSEAATEVFAPSPATGNYAEEGGDGTSEDQDRATTVMLPEDAGTAALPLTGDVSGQRDPRDATRVMTAHGASTAPRAPGSGAGAAGRGLPPSPAASRTEAPTDPYEPRVVLGSTAPYRVWVWLLVWVLAACAAAYLGWLAGVRLLDAGTDGALGATTGVLGLSPS